MDKLLNQRNSLSALVFFLLLLNGCSREGQKTEYVARVNDSYLTEEDLTAVSERYGGHQFFKEEQIRSWINRELLYQQAVKEGILDENKYKILMKNAGRELAASLMIEKWYSENTPVYQPEEVKVFFEKHQDEFRFTESAFLVNMAEFSDENRAVTFRSAAVESDWNKALNFFNKDTSLSKLENERLLFSSDLQPLKLNRIINELYPGEVSLIIPVEGNYLVIMLVSRFEAGTLPPFDVIKEKAEKRFVAEKKTELLKEYYESLYSSNEIDIKR